MKRTVAIVAFFAVTPAGADPAQSIFKRGLSEFQRAEWKRAVKSLLSAAPRLKEPKERAIAYRQAGLARVELKQDRGAEEAFMLALTADPLVDVDPVEVQPRSVDARATRWNSRCRG